MKNEEIKYWGSLVSVYIPTRDRSQMLKRAVLSVINQNYPFIEIIVVDDNSVDDTELIIRELQLKHPNIVYMKMATSLGAPSARNIAIKASKGEFVTGLDDDDEFMPGRIEQLINAYQDEFSFVCTNVIKSLGKNNLPNKDEILSLDKMLFKNCASNQVFTKKERYVTLGGFDENLKSSQDYDLWVRLVQKFGSALRLKNATYIWNVNHTKERISTSNLRNFGHLQFFSKHKYLMTRSHRKAQIFKSFKNRRKPISFCQFINYTTTPLFWEDTKYLILSLTSKLVGKN